MRASALGIGDVVRQQLYDQPLLRMRGGAPAATAPCVLEGQFERARAAAILASRIGAVRQENTYGRRTPRPHSAMQRRHATLVYRIRVRTRTEQVRDNGRLRSWRPRCRSRLAVTGVVNRLCASAIAGTDVGAAANEAPRDVGPVRRRGNVERRVAGIHVVLNLLEEVRRCRVTRRAD